MTQKHTQGPWYVNPRDDQEVLGPDGEPIFNHYNDGVCGTEPANARLVAAAPELLEALLEALPYVPEHHGPVIHKINEAIAKAKGETQ